jgi:hypothetical protein
MIESDIMTRIMVRTRSRVRFGRRVRCWLLLLFAAAACTGRQSPPADSAHKRVDFSILEDYDKGDDLDDIAKDFDLFHELGVTTWRGSFGWDDYEPSQGAYDFEWLHRFADLAASRGITLRPYIGYTPSWASAGGTDTDVWNDPPKDLEAWYRFVRRLAGEMRRHRNIVSYEIYNEENVRQWWDGTAAAYREVLRRGADAIRDGNPDAQVLLGGMVYPDAEWVGTMCQDNGSGRRVDVIPFHAYPETWTPPDVRVETYLGPTFAQSFVHETDLACGRKALWINETGYATTPGRTEADQARWWLRAVATFVAQPRIEHIGIYEIKDLRADRAAIGDQPNYHLGLTTVDRKKKMAFGTVARLVSLLRGDVSAIDKARLTVSGSTPDGKVYHSLFSRADGTHLLFLWAQGTNAVVDVQLSVQASRAIEYAIDGREDRQLTIAGGVMPGVTLQPGEVRLFELSR